MYLTSIPGSLSLALGFELVWYYYEIYRLKEYGKSNGSQYNRSIRAISLIYPM